MQISMLYSRCSNPPLDFVLTQVVAAEAKSAGPRLVHEGSLRRSISIPSQLTALHSWVFYLSYFC